jgi:hypothetical protein
MKSSDNTLLLAGLFVLIVVIIALIVYYTRPGETKSSDQTSDTTELKVENLTFERTLNPDPSVGNGVSGYTIEPYGVEYAGEVDYKELSRNVTFTMNWTNAPGFNDVVKGFEIEHWVRDTTTNPAEPKYFNKRRFKYHKNQAGALEGSNRGQDINFKNFGDNKMKLICSDLNNVSDNTTTSDNKCLYSVIGDNAFKLYAVTAKTGTTFSSADSATHTLVELFNGVGADDGKDITAPPELQISTNQLAVTLSMTTPETILFTPKAPNETSSRTVISKSTYTISNYNNSSTLVGVYLTTVPKTGGKHFYLTFEDGKFLMIDKADGTLKKQLTETATVEKFIFEIVDRPTTCVDDQGNAIKDCDVTKGKMRQAASRFLGTSAKTVAEGPETIPTGTAEKDRKYLSTDSAKKLKLYTQKDSSLTKTIYGGFTWTFRERIAGALGLGVSSRSAGDLTGKSVCILGDDAFVGEPGVSNSKGRVTVYKRNTSGEWKFKQSINGTNAGSEFGYSVSFDGDETLVVGAPGSKVNDIVGTGQINIYIKNSEGNFELKKTYTRASADFEQGSQSRFGTVVSIDGDVILVGAPGSQGTGRITLLKKGTSWLISSNVGRSTVNRGEGGFGKSLGLDTSRNQFIAGAENSGNGVAYIYTFSDAGVISDTLDTVKKIGLPTPNNEFGQSARVSKLGASVAIKGDTIYIGAPDYAGTQSTSPQGGRVYILKRGNTQGGDRSEWTFDKILNNGKVNGAAPGVLGGYMSEQMGVSEDGSKFGSSIDISGDKLIIGSSGSSKVYVYTGVLSSTGNTPITRYLSSNHPEGKKVPVRLIEPPTKQVGSLFGASVSIDGDYAMIGEPNRTSTAKHGDSYIVPV